jgi:hypothetical protein
MKRERLRLRAGRVIVSDKTGSLLIKNDLQLQLGLANFGGKVNVRRSA